ncbi:MULTISPECIES: 4'-phosphopantetheinyl transferase [unclassified Vibrio]|uniref:Enterobactin synthase component D n=1 Tax=Vibrio sp. HB236076 TaxID=3232307 RepID=A0AB39H8J9_9VIBR|nr:4'-phosphopantetheinyl transferase superfamily protein [Vibrio sp. HB161653]MDP5253786.1 4'-phosphopantetheinyl transferase superfamily protein [Vibrio sp. HB161653]
MTTFAASAPQVISGKPKMAWSKLQAKGRVWYRLGGVAIYAHKISEPVKSVEHAALPSPIADAPFVRQQEFLAGRKAADKALKAINIDAPMLPIGDHRSPLWPEGVTGSISHKGAWAIACAQRQDVRQYLGVDIEQPLSVGVANAIATVCADDDERAYLSRHVRLVLGDKAFHDVGGDNDWALLITALFSAKESLFKAVYPAVNQYLEFSDAKLIAWQQEAQVMWFAFQPQWSTLAKRVWPVYLGQRHGLVVSLAKGDRPSE